MLFDSLHSPIFGRICRIIYREKFSRTKYRTVQSPEREEQEIARIAIAAETVFAKEKDPNLEKIRVLVPA
jgi:hypothetical protein